MRKVSIDFVYYRNAEILIEEARQSFCATLYNNVNNFGQRYRTIFNNQFRIDLAVVHASDHVFTKKLYLFAINKGDIATECEITLATSNRKYIEYKYIIQPKDILIYGYSQDRFLREDININGRLCLEMTKGKTKEVSKKNILVEFFHTYFRSYKKKL